MIVHLSTVGNAQPREPLHELEVIQVDTWGEVIPEMSLSSDGIFEQVVRRVVCQAGGQE